jgi:hypothetical protein
VSLARVARCSLGVAEALGVAWALGAGCAPPPEPPRRAEATLASSEDELGSEFGSVEATGQGLELDLPDTPGWRHDARDERSFVAVHAATRSRLIVKAWNADSIARPDDCEQQLRQLRPELPVLAPEQRIEERSLRVAGDHTARLMAGVVPSPGPRRDGGAVLFGHALLFGSDGRHCLALIYSTSAQGGAAPRSVGERLGAMTRVTFERVRRLGIDQRVRVERR